MLQHWAASESPAMEEPRAGCYQLGMGSLRLPPARPHGAKAPGQGNSPCNQPWGPQTPPCPHPCRGGTGGTRVAAQPHLICTPTPHSVPTRLYF